MKIKCLLLGHKFGKKPIFKGRVSPKLKREGPKEFIKPQTVVICERCGHQDTTEMLELKRSPFSLLFP